MFVCKVDPQGNNRGLSMNNVCILARRWAGICFVAAPYMQPGMLVARASPPGLGASSKM